MIGIVAVVLAVPILAIGGYAGYLAVSGKPFLDEWQCSEGELPADNVDGGRACFPEGATLPRGWAWDPLGNRPLECSDRWGWTEVVKTGQDIAHGTDCLREGRPLPDGYEAVE